MEVKDWALLAFGVWTVLVATGIGIKMTQAVIDWIKKK